MGRVPHLDATIQQLLRDGGVPGLSIATIRHGEVAQIIAAGTRNTSTGAPVEAKTIFDAASLSKPMFAYAVLQLIDAGALSLDTPLAERVPDYVSNDPRAADVTVRHVLSHTTGLPNWRSKDRPLRTYFPPGERFNYSGEGFVWLQRVVEAISGKPIDAVMQDLVFDPFEMSDSGYVWRPQFDTNYADPHDATLVAGTKFKPTAANTASSLQTTASDYARFVQTVLSGARLKPATKRLWLEPQMRVRWHRSQCLAPAVPESDQRVAWSLGWGLEPDHGTFFHWGDNGRFKSFAIGSAVHRSAAVVFANGENGMSIMSELIDRLMPGEHPVFKWLDYTRYVANER
jgi:CubicO group peptidase (beta-lactamase class C family)